MSKSKLFDVGLFRSYQKADWQSWGSQFGWHLESVGSGGAEFKVPFDRDYEYISISQVVARDIALAIADARSTGEDVGFDRGYTSAQEERERE